MTFEQAARYLRRLITSSTRRWIWRLLTLISLVVAGAGLVYAWRDAPSTNLGISPEFLGLALAIYALTYWLRLLGWHSLSRYLLGEFPLGDDAEAVAGSSFVKYLPTVGWYIANRASYYARRQVSRRAVVKASLYELGVMIISGTLLYAALFLIPDRLITLGWLVVICGGIIWVLMHRRAGTRLHEELANSRHLVAGLVWCGSTWPVGTWFLWALLHAFIPLQLSDWTILFPIWLLAGLGNHILSITIGSVGIIRELTLVAFMAQVWPLPAAVATAIAVKTILTIGDLALSAMVLWWRQGSRKRIAND